MSNKFAVVTGASTGIGKAVAITLAKKGFFVALVARRIDKLEETKKLIIDAGGKAKIFPTDLSKIESINELISKIKLATRNIRVLVNIAGIWHGQNEVYTDTDFEKFSQKIILDTYAVGLTAPTLLSHGLLPLMSKDSQIINLSGTFENGAKGWLPYYVSKRAIEDLTAGLAEELKDREIKVNGVSPSDVATEEYQKYFPQDAKSAVSPQEVAEFIFKILSSNQTGKVFVFKKGHKFFEKFHC
ncbi:SDR family oxidoreductase [Candidatus Gottesmanbacteria bacterium]|nr:SDR family oxidoreductase [Candidatus Gottesmanbacteria bacterium]